MLVDGAGDGNTLLERALVDAVAQGLFHIYTAEHASEGIALLTGHSSGMPMDVSVYANDCVLGHAQKTLQAYRHACQLADRPKLPHRRAR